MAWMRTLAETYDTYSYLAGIVEYDQPILLPLYHSVFTAQIEVTLDSDGNFVDARKIEEGKGANTIIPVTEDSDFRPGQKSESNLYPHPLCDELCYIAGDYPQYTGQNTEDYYKKYMEQLYDWAQSDDTHPMIQGIYSYLEKKNLIRDLIKKRVTELRGGTCQMVIELTMAMAEICLMVYLYKSGYKQYTYVYMLISLPVLFFCINMLDEAVTVDEMQYMKAFIDISGMQQGSYIWNKATYQYRLTQMVMGTIFRIQNWIYPELTDNVSLIIYKMIHWLMYYLVALFTAFVWGSKILSIDKDSQRYRISSICILYVLIGMPISCLIMKVCNYDAGNVYFAIAGFSLTIAAEKQKNPRLAFWGAVVAVFGCMEKWGCLIYWCICVSFYAFFFWKKLCLSLFRKDINLLTLCF